MLTHQPLQPGCPNRPLPLARSVVSCAKTWVLEMTQKARRERLIARLVLLSVLKDCQHLLGICRLCGEDIKTQFHLGGRILPPLWDHFR